MNVYYIYLINVIQQCKVSVNFVSLIFMVLNNINVYILLFII